MGVHVPCAFEGNPKTCQYFLPNLYELQNPWVFHRTTSLRSPPKDYIDPVTFSAPAGSFKSIAAGYVHTCAVDEATELITCWGSDLHGETAGPGEGEIGGAARDGHWYSLG